MRKLKCILLIDDDEPTNFLHQILIEQVGCCEVIVSKEDGLAALAYLKKEENLKPDLILLDINMPRMNGWEFLAEYAKLEGARKAEALVLMLTTALRPVDQEKAEGISEINALKSKPLNVEMIEELMSQFFS